MSFNTNWDVDQYKTEHESEEHWDLRRKFMIAHKDKFPEERLVCLAQVFTNVEFLGCRYPEETMRLVAELSEGVADEYREKQKTKLQRTFVKASDAAGAKVKGLKRPAAEAAGPVDTPPKYSKLNDSPAAAQPTVISPNISVPQLLSKETGVPLSTGKETLPSKKESELNGCQNSFSPAKQGANESIKVESASPPQITVTKLTRKNLKILKDGASNKDRSLDILDAGVYGRLVLVEDESETYPAQIISRSTSVCQIPFRFEYEDCNYRVLCRVLVNDHVLTTASHSSKKIAREIAAKTGLEKLKEMCYTVKVKKKLVAGDEVVDKSVVMALDGRSLSSKRSGTPKGMDTPLPEDNIGSKLLRSMGWKGGGLGKDQQGIQEPVSVALRVNRAGLGLKKESGDSGFKSKARHFLYQYMDRESHPNLIIKFDFTPMERDVIHQLAKTMGLYSKLCGKGEEGQLVICKRETFVAVAARMLRRGIYSDDKYELIKPRPKSSVDEEHSSHESGVSSSGVRMECELVSAARRAGILTSRSAVKQSDGEKFEDRIVLKSALKRPSKQRCKSLRAAKRAAKIARQLEKKKEQLEKKKERAERCHQSKQRHHALDPIAAGPYGNLFLIEDEEAKDVQTYNVFLQSTNICNISCRYEYGSYKTGAFCKLYVNDVLLSSACSINKKEARHIAVQNGYTKLKGICYTLKIKKKFIPEGDVIEKAENAEKSGGVEAQEKTSEPSLPEPTDIASKLLRHAMGWTAAKELQGSSLDVPLGENIGSKLMRSMGWAGGGLGKDQQGIQEPVRVSQKVNRAGLGLAQSGFDGKRFRSKMNDMLRDYAHKETTCDLVFASDFSTEERAVLHQLATIWKLKSKSYGKGKSRHLVISKKRDFVEIVEEMLHTGQHITDRYELIRPQNPLLQKSADQPQTCAEGGADTGTSSSLLPPETSDKFLYTRLEPSSDVQIIDNPSAPEPSFGIKVNAEKVKVSEDNITNVNASSSTVSSGLYGRLVLFEDETCTNPTQIIERSANGCHISFKYEYENIRGGMMCKFFVNNCLVTSASEFSKKRAREVAVSTGLDKLRSLCYTLKTQIKMEDNGLTILKTLKEPRKLGLQGNQKLINIVCTSKQVDRETLGIRNVNGVNPTIFKRKVRDFLRDYTQESWPYDLVVSPDFTSPERLFFQKTASGFGLKSNLYEVTKQDFMVISKKQSIVETVEAMLRSGGNSHRTSRSGEVIVL